jgi:signal peptidase II
MKIFGKRPFMFFALLVALDQMTKYIVRTRLALGESVEITFFFRLNHAVNSGVAFSMFQGANRFFAVFSILVLAGIFFWYRKNRSFLSAGVKLSLLLIVAGAVGNLIDRIVHGHVVDFLLFGIGSYQWPSFNVADSCITVGGLILFYNILRPGKKPLV